MAYHYTRDALYNPHTLPVFSDNTGPAPVPVGNQSAIQVRDAWWMSKFSHLAYYPVDQWAKELDKVGLSLVASFDHKGTQAFLARGGTWAVVCFRGTQPNESVDLLQDLKARAVTIQDEVKAHYGFVEALDFIWPALQAALDELGGLELWYTGHSLGAALSVLAATRRPATAVVNFGCPRVGQQGLDSLLQGTRHVVRVVNGCDIVTRVPPSAMGYEHVGTEFFLSPNGELVVDPDPKYVSQTRAAAALSYQAQVPLAKGWVLDKSMADHAIPNYSAGLDNHL